jgi:hypothetical protein
MRGRVDEGEEVTPMLRIQKLDEPVSPLIAITKGA